MSSKIKTNQLNCILNYDKIDEQYDLFYVQTSNKFFKSGAYILDSQLLNNSIKSILFECGRKFYVLMKKQASNMSILKQVISETDEAKNCTIEAIHCKSLPDHYILQLLLNSMATRDNPILSFNNLTGHFYCFHPEWIKKDEQSNVVWQIPCLEIKIEEGCKLSLSIRTFTSELLRKKITFGKKKFDDYPKYVFSVKNTLRRKLKSDHDVPCFIMRQLDGKKEEKAFLDIQSIAHFEKSKMGILAEIIIKFNNEFADVAKVEFNEIDECASVECNQVLKENKKTVANYLKATPIRIVDTICDEYSEIFCEEISSYLKDNYIVDVRKTKKLCKNALNIRIIHNVNYYGDNIKDPHQDNLNGHTVQHITFEDFKSNSKAAITTIIHELIIKNDLHNKRISLFDWQSLEFDNDVIFGISSKIEENYRYFFMTIHPDGSFDIEEQQLDLFNITAYTDCVNIFEDDSFVRGIIKYSDSSIDVISETGLYTIPDILNLRSELAVGNTYLRNKIKRDELLSSILDIKMYEQNNEQFYFVGTIGNGMQAKVERACLVRSVKSYNNVRTDFSRLLHLMNISFVRNGQLTVLPFPYKYLREYVNTH